MKVYESSFSFLTKGIPITINGRQILVQALLLSGVFDAPAKSEFLNHVQHTGFFGCPYCKEKGETCWTSNTGHKTIFPFNTDSISGHADSRTHQENVQFADQAQQKRLATGKENNVYGVKGKTRSFYFPKFDVVKSVAIDYMHCILLGVVKMLMSLWSDGTLVTRSRKLIRRSRQLNFLMLSADYQEVCQILETGRLLSFGAFCCFIQDQFCGKFYLKNTLSTICY